MKIRGGQHQALEMKEKLKLSQENRAIAAITYQNLFLLFPKMAGMSGTISDAADEIRDVYGVDVTIIPPNCPMQRKDLKDFYFKDIESQFSAAIETVVKTHKTGQPVLVVASTIGETELISKLLIEERIPHSVLNANNAFWEAEIIKEAGQMNAVTVATAMAGRGTDIRLGEGVKELGGLAVIGIGRMENIRQERQARGRAGRQGNPGFSRFYVSIYDGVVKDSGLIKYEKYEDGKKRISKRKIRKVVNTAQKNNEESAVFSRKSAMEYDQVMQRQRAVIYAIRDELLDGGVLEESKVLDIARKNIKDFLQGEKQRDQQTICRYILDNISYRLDEGLSDEILQSDEEIEEFLMQRVIAGLTQQEEKLGNREKMDDFVRIVTLQAIDDAWVEEVDYLQQLQSAVSGRSSAQRKLVYEYQGDALEAFRKMEKTVLKNIIRNILLSDVSIDGEGLLRMIRP